MQTLINISETAIEKTKAIMVFGSSNKFEDLERTHGWVNTMDSQCYSTKASNFGFRFATPNACDKLSSGVIGMEYHVDNAVAATVVRGGNCTYMSALAMKFIAQDHRFKNMTAKIKYMEPAEKFDHSFVEVSDGIHTIYCDPWLGKSWIVDEQIHALLSLEILKEEKRNTELLLLKGKPKWIYPPEKSELEIGLITDEELQLEINNLNAAISKLVLCVESHQPYISQESIAIKTECWDRFILSDSNKDVYLKLFEFFRVLELTELYPNPRHGLWKVIEAHFQELKPYLVSTERYADRTTSREGLKWWLSHGVSPDSNVDGTPLLFRAVNLHTNIGTGVAEVNEDGFNINKDTYQGIVQKLQNQPLL